MAAGSGGVSGTAGDLANSTRLCAVEGVVDLNGLRVIQIENALPRNPYPPTSY